MLESKGLKWILNQKKRKTKKITLEFFEDREKEIQKCLCFIQKSIDQDKKIPTIIISKILSILEEGIGVEQDFTSKIISDNVFERFNNKNYFFKGKVVQIEQDILNEGEEIYEEEEIVTNYNLKTMIDYVVNEIHNRYKGVKEVSKETYIIDVFKSIESYCNKFLNNKNKKFLTTYKRQSITGFVVTQFGYHLTESRTPTNYQLFQATRNSISKIKKEATT